MIPHPEKLLGKRYCEIIDDVLCFPRSGWILRGIPKEKAETVSAHSAKTAIATKLYIESQMLSILPDTENETVLTAGLHDMVEWKKIDYTPS